MRTILFRGLALFAVTLCFAPPARAQDGVFYRELDASISDALREAISQGADLYQAGDHAGCYRLFQGALLATTPLLDHRPDLRKSVEAKMVEAKKLSAPHEQATVLREALNDIRAAIKKDTPTRRSGKPLWDLLGGEKVVRSAVKDFVQIVMADKKLNFDRNGKYKIDVPTLEQRLVEFISAISDGPLTYTGRNMIAVHAGMRITDEEFTALASHLTITLNKHKVPKAEIGELITRVGKARPYIVEGDKPLWDRLGGEDLIKGYVHDFLEVVIKDPKVNFYRGAKFKPDQQTTEKQLVRFIGSITGGPFEYKGRDMKKAHAGMKITETEFDALAGHLVTVLKNNRVPQAYIDELMVKVATTKKDIVEK